MRICGDSQNLAAQDRQSKHYSPSLMGIIDTTNSPNDSGQSSRGRHRQTLNLIRLMAGAVLFSIMASLPGEVEAHVKWFAPYDLSRAPHSPSMIWNSVFIQLALVSMLGLWSASVIETTRLGHSLLVGLNLLTETARLRTDQFLRCCLAAFFIALWSHGGIILTPELTTDRWGVEWLQVAIAAGMFWQAGMIFSGLGIIALFAHGIQRYGWFHMMDYPIFLGFASYCILIGLYRGRAGTVPQTVVRWSIGITLMWASVEKWGYPEWTYPILDQHPDLAVGFSHPFYMTAAGMAEFVFAFALLWTPLVRRLAAIVLFATFVSAIFEFGKIDAIGHLPIIAALVVIVVEPSLGRHYPRPFWLPGCFAVALVVFVTAYCAAHAVLMHPNS